MGPRKEPLLLGRALKKNMKKHAFTLIELILVVSIILALAFIAIPNYSKSKFRAMEREAISNVKLMAAGEGINKMEQGGYIDCSGAADCNSSLRLMLNATNWLYSCKGGTITASAQSATGMSISCTYTLTPPYNNEPTESASCP